MAITAPTSVSGARTDAQENWTKHPAGSNLPAVRIGEMSSVQEQNSGVDVTGVTLTPAAVRKALALLDQEGRSDLRLRIAVQPGGCAGLRYQLFFDDRSMDGDVVTRYNALADTGDDSGNDSGYESGADDE